MEQVAGAWAPGHWYQLYWSSDDDLVASLVRRAEACGSEAIVVTLDTAYLGWRPRDLDLGHLPFARGEGIAQYTSDPVFQRLVAERVAAKARGRARAAAPAHPGGGAHAGVTEPQPPRRHPEQPVGAPSPAPPVETFLDVFSRPSLSWADLPLAARAHPAAGGAQGGAAPRRRATAVDEGVDGISCRTTAADRSTGGRGPRRAAGRRRCRALLGLDVPVLFDSGIRSGADVFVALALGADAVGIGRPHVYGLAIAGQAGVAEVLRTSAAELDLTLALTGCRTLADITRDRLVEAPLPH